MVARCTQRARDGSAMLVAGVDASQACERLAAHEDLLDALHARLAGVGSQIAALRAAGKIKTVTYQQLVGTKMTLREMLGYYEERGL